MSTTRDFDAEHPARITHSRNSEHNNEGANIASLQCKHMVSPLTHFFPLSYSLTPLEAVGNLRYYQYQDTSNHLPSFGMS
jgi:hypothetical protein